MKPRNLAIVCFALLGLVALVPAAGAQDRAREFVQAALDETDRRIGQAETILASSDNERAEMELNLAKSMQDQAKTAFATTSTQLEFELVMRLTQGARLHALRAIAIVRDQPDPDRVRAQLERTRELIERARDRIEECNHDRARAMLHVAIEMQERAETAWREQRFLAALQLTMSARERAIKALRLCNAEENLRDSAERALRRTDEVIARAQDIVAERGSEQAREVLARAVQLQERAMDEFRSSHFEASLRLTQAARAAAYRSIRMSGGGL